MRLARTIWDKAKAEKIARWLRQQGIEVELQAHPHEAPSSWRLWILDEDQIERAREWIDSVEKGTLNIDDSLSVEVEAPIQSSISKSTIKPLTKKKSSDRPWITQILISFMVILHAVLHLYLPFQKMNALMQSLMIESSSSHSDSTLWQGLYTHLICFLKNKPLEWNWSSFLFDVRCGDLWRLFSPTLLHADWIHLLFNMLWLSLLGSALEVRIGRIKMLVLILISALVSNIFQYLMAGSAFLGFSGVVMALVGFIYSRCRYFPWEDYPITSSTFNFIGFYLILTLSLQLVSFILETLSVTQTGMGIANTAHLTGLFVGWALGKSRAMSLKP